MTVTVLDTCEGCAAGDLDFSPSAFQQLASQSLGRLDGLVVSPLWLSLSPWCHSGAALTIQAIASIVGFPVNKRRNCDGEALNYGHCCFCCF